MAKRVVAEFRVKNVTFLAGSIAYNAFVSLVPLLLFLFLAVSVLESGRLEARVLRLSRRYLSPAIADVLARMLSTENATGASVVGLVTLLWGSLKIFRGLDTAFSEIFESEMEKSIVDQLRDGLVVLVSLAVAVTAMTGATAVFAAFEAVPFIGWLNPLLLVVGLGVAFFPIFYLFPDVDVSPKEILPGVAVAAVGWALLQGLFQVYVGLSSRGDEVNLVAGIILLITWLYFSAVVFLLGAVVSAVLGGYASGVGGGVGEAAMTDWTARDERMDRAELATYLRGLREDLTDRYEGMRPATEADRHDRPYPADGVAVLERARTDAGDWEVRLRWGPADEGTDEAEE